MAILTARKNALRAHLPEIPSIGIGTLRRNRRKLSMGEVTYLRHGRGAPLLLVHGFPTSARLWEPLLGILGEHYDCIAPDLLGLGQSQPTANTDLSSPGQAHMLVELLDTLEIPTAFVVLHDQGGAHGMQLMKLFPDRVRAVALSNVVCYDNWPVPPVSSLMALCRLPGFTRALARLGLLQWAMEHFPLPQTTVRTPLSPRLLAEWWEPLDAGGERFEAWIRYLRSQSNRWTLEAVPTLQAWKKPSLVVWGADDEFLPPSWGAQLAHDLPTAPNNPHLLPFAGHFWQTEVPVTGARILTEFFDSLT